MRVCKTKKSRSLSFDTSNAFQKTRSDPAPSRSVRTVSFVSVSVTSSSARRCIANRRRLVFPRLFAVRKRSRFILCFAYVLNRRVLGLPKVSVYFGYNQYLFYRSTVKPLPHVQNNIWLVTLLM